MKPTTKNIDETIKQIKEYLVLQEQLKAEIVTLKAACIKYLDEHATDEYLCDEGKITYREVLSNRFQSTAFKKIHGDLYKAFVKPTVNMRFTCN